MRLVLNRVWIPAAYRQQPQSEWLLVSPFGRRPSLPWEHLPGLGLRDHVPRTDGRDGLLLRWEGNNGGKYPRGLHGEGNCRKTKGEFTLSRDAKLVRQKIWNVNFCLTCSWRIVFYVRRLKLKLSFMINRLWTSIVFWYFASLLRFNDEGTNIRQSSFMLGFIHDYVHDIGFKFIDLYHQRLSWHWGQVQRHFYRRGSLWWGPWGLFRVVLMWRGACELEESPERDLLHQ